MLMSLGCHGSAIEILTRLQIWEELALCYLALGRKAKASEVIQEQLDKRPTPTLLCVMGDITQVGMYVATPTHYPLIGTSLRWVCM